MLDKSIYVKLYYDQFQRKDWRRKVNTHQEGRLTLPSPKTVLGQAQVTGVCRINNVKLVAEKDSHKDIYTAHMLLLFLQ